VDVLLARRGLGDLGEGDIVFNEFAFQGQNNSLSGVSKSLTNINDYYIIKLKDGSGVPGREGRAEISSPFVLF
jgi:hypothetical protein